MKKQFIYLFASAALMVAAMTGCKKDSKAPENEEELITTIKLRFTEVGTANTLIFTFRDADGPGGNAPTLNELITLAPNKQYNCAIEVLDESKTPAEDITDEINDEADEHQFYFTPAGVNITVSGLNTDGKGFPLGVNSTWSTGAASGPGTVKVTLKHKPGGIKGANDPITVGETDIEVSFAARVQ